MLHLSGKYSRINSLQTSGMHSGERDYVGIMAVSDWWLLVETRAVRPSKVDLIDSLRHVLYSCTYTDTVM